MVIPYRITKSLKSANIFAIAIWGPTTIIMVSITLYILFEHGDFQWS